MKRKTIAVIVCILFFVSLFPLHALASDNYLSTNADVFQMPASLLVIETEAFEDTSVEMVIMPYGVREIGDRAFVNTEQLKMIYIPSSIQFIADTAFGNRTNMYICGVAGGYAEEWAVNHGITYVPYNAAILLIERGRILNPTAELGPWHNVIKPQRIIIPHGGTEYIYRSMRPQDRPELNIINYKFP